MVNTVRPGGTVAVPTMTYGPTMLGTFRDGKIVSFVRE
jgi:hypothetical protein